MTSSRNGPRQLARRVARWLTSPPQLGRESALRWTERVGALTAMVGSIEYLRGGSQLGRHGLNDVAVAAVPDDRRQALLNAVASPRGAKLLHLGRVVSAGALLLPTGRAVRLAADANLAVSSRLIMYLEPRGMDGSDEVALLVQSATASARVVDDPAVDDAALWFLALQSGLSYLAAGVAKLASPTWTRGHALTGIFRTQAYGHRGLWQFLDGHPSLARRATQGVVVGELLLPLLLVRRDRGARSYVAVGALFHLANAYVMGLGRFMLAFSGLYPAVLYVSSPTASGRSDRLPAAGGGRSDRLPAVAGALTVAAVGAQAGVALADRRHRAHGARGRQRHRTARGSVLAYDLATAVGRDRDGDGPRPLVVLEAGLGGTSHHWSIVRDGLVRRGFDVLSYDRAGYLSSTRAAGAQPDLDAHRDDLVSLVDAVGGERAVILVGHSLGGHLVVRAADLLAERLCGLVTLDAAHAEQWDRLETSATLGDRSLAIIEHSLRLGLGVSLEMPPEVHQTDPALRRILVATHRAASTWSAVRWEVEAMRRAGLSTDVPAEPGRALREPGAVLAMTASSTAQAEPAQLDADRRLAGSGRHIVVERCTHLGLLLDATAAATVVDEIATFAAARLAATAAGSASTLDRSR